MMHYLESDATDPQFNLALEQYVFDGLGARHDCFMLWRNHNAVIVGRHQNTAGEINADYVREHGISVVRRLSGGGAVYHDLGNVNFTFIVSAHEGRVFDFASFCRPVIAALASLGVTAAVNGRNDMTIDGKKFSGNAQYRKHGRLMHHGTILYDSDLETLGKALVVPRDKIASKGIKSVQSRVANVKSHMSENISVERFMGVLRDAMFREYGLTTYALSAEDRAAVAVLQREVYADWNWNYGASPAYSIRKERRVPDCGKVEVHMDVEKSVIKRIAFYGDYFSHCGSAELEQTLIGRRVERSSLADAIATFDVGACFHNLDAETFLDILTS